MSGRTKPPSISTLMLLRPYGVWFGVRKEVGIWSLAKIMELQKNDICLLEFYPILVAFKMFGQEVRNKRVLIHTDNMGVKCIINNQTSKDPYIMVLLRDFVLTLLQLNVDFKAEYVSTKSNDLADPLSRQQVHLFKSRAPDADAQPTQIPKELLPEHYDITFKAY